MLTGVSGRAASLEGHGFRPASSPGSAQAGETEMRSLQQQDVVDEFARDCLLLWNSWLKPKNQPTVDLAGTRAFCRKDLLKNAIQDMTNGVILRPGVEFKALPKSWGCFLWDKWALHLNESFLQADDIKYGEFIEICLTAYHETRHAEQAYRVAQGLAAGVIAFPDKLGLELVQHGGVAGGVAAKLASIKNARMGARQAVIGMDPTARAQVIADLLKIPLTTAQAAEASSAEFNDFLALPKPEWFRRATSKLEVEDWLRADFKKTLHEMDSLAQEHGNNSGFRMKAMYHALPEENDAHAIEEMVSGAIVLQIGHPTSKQVKRTNTALFGE
jgi:hypothetical protein